MIRQAEVGDPKKSAWQQGYPKGCEPSGSGAEEAPGQEICRNRE